MKNFKIFFPPTPSVNFLNPALLSGMLAPTAGTAVIANHDLVQNPQSVRKNLGLCPQGNLLLDDLTVTEHLYFFCKLKGLPEGAIAAEAAKYIKALQLEPKADELSKHLSGKFLKSKDSYSVFRETFQVG